MHPWVFWEIFRRLRSRLVDRSASEVAREPGIHIGQIHNWRNQFNKLAKHQFTISVSDQCAGPYGYI